MTLLTRLEAIKKVWVLLLPWCEIPPDATLARWLMGYPDAELEKVLYQTAAYWSKRPHNVPENVHRYISGTLSQRKLKRQRQSENAGATTANVREGF